MEKFSHTPGPWWTDGEYIEEECGCAIIAARTDCGPLPGNPTRGMVAFASQLLPEKGGECAANARLIAAAPELMEALRGLVEAMSLDGDPAFAHLVLDARAAIAKAMGE